MREGGGEEPALRLGLSNEDRRMRRSTKRSESMGAGREGVVVKKPGQLLAAGSLTKRNITKRERRS